jgi:phage baseplate assembly protein W
MVDIRVSEAAISLPFSISEFGTVATTSSQEKIWADRVRSAVGTAVGERVLRPDYGTEIAANAFNTLEAAAEVLKQQVDLAFSRDLRLLRLVSTNVSMYEPEATLEAEITYALPNRTVEVVLIGFATLLGNLPLIEDVAK